MSQGYCVACEVHGTDAICWCCGGTMLFGIPLHLTASHSYSDEARSALVSGQTLYVSEVVETII